MFRNLAQDTRLAARALARRPAFTLTAVASLALGLGAVVTVFAVADALFLTPLPYREPDRLVAVWPSRMLGNREVAAFRDRARSLDDVASLSPGWLMALTGVSTPRQLDASRISGNLFSLLGVTPVLGRAFGPDAEQPGRAPEVLLSWELWRDAFGADPRVLGRSIVLDQLGYQVVGVMGRDFRPLGKAADLWTPMTMDPTDMPWAGATVHAYARLRRGLGVAAAAADVRAIAADLQREFGHSPDWTTGAGVVGLQESMVSQTRTTVLVLAAAVAFLLLIAAANVANLLLVRNAERRHELAVRASLGATPGAIGRFVAAEGAVIGAAGALGGIALAVAGVALVRRILPPDLPRLEAIAVDARVVAAAAVLGAVTAAIFSLVPAVSGRDVALATRVRSGGRTLAGQGQRARGLVVAAEVGLAVILTTGAMLMGRTLVALHHVDPGFRTDHLLTMVLQPSGRTSEQLRTYWDEVLARVRAVPGVTAAATVLHRPVGGRTWQGDVEVDGRPLPPGVSPQRTAWQVVSPGYFRTAGIPLLRGREFGPGDRADVPRVIAVNTVFAERVFPGEDPVGRRVKAGNGTQNEWATIVAVVGAVRHDSLNGPPGPEIYAPFSQRVVVATALVLRTATPPLAVARAVQEQVWTVDPDVPISDVRAMDDLYAASLSRQRMVLVLLGLFAGLGLLLSAVGIYGTVAYGVRQRLREIGIRMALGADAGAIRRLVLGSGLGYAALGLLAGGPVAWVLAPLMRSQVYGVTPGDPATFALVPCVLVLVAAAASWIPARRAAAGDPTVVLRDG